MRTPIPRSATRSECLVDYQARITNEPNVRLFPALLPRTSAISLGKYQLVTGFFGQVDLMNEDKTLGMMQLMFKDDRFYYLEKTQTYADSHHLVMDENLYIKKANV